MMSSQMFLVLLFAFSLISSLITEVIKNICSDKKHLAYNIIILVISLIVGCGGCFVYYILNDIAFTLKSIIFAILVGCATSMTASLGYDKVKQAIDQILGK